MDIVEQMAADIAMKMNGGEWTDGKWYSQGHRDAWVKAVQPYADIIEKLREESQQQSDAVSRAYSNGYDSAYAMGYSEGLKETLYDGMPRRDDRDARASPPRRD